MHPDVTSDQPGRCPRCGMKLLAAGPVTHTAGDDMADTPAGVAHHEHGDAGEHVCGMKAVAPACRRGPRHPVHATTTCTSRRLAARRAAIEHAPPTPSTTAVEHHEHAARAPHEARHAALALAVGAPSSLGVQRGGHEHGAADGIEWEDDMVEINRLTTTANMHWKFVDRTTGAATAAIDWRFTVGDRVKIRLVERDGLRPPDAPPVPPARRRAFPRPGPRRSARDPTWSGRTPSWSAPGRPSTSCSTSPTPACGWPTAISPNTCRAA